LPNGSGLSRQARLSPEAMVRALRAIREDFVVGPELIAALPLLGVDGTLTAFRRSAARGQVRAKTGTLAGATCLSGYVMVQGRGLYFSFMGARIRHLYRLRRRHVAMIEALRRYLKTLGGRAAPRLDTPSRSDPRDPHSLQTGRR
ncbi:MAG: D-alanyl-D-alanine carboxypeptidase, partial [Deltaproteobacteria bacterium]|nr:D-alanyl-D-alanine carboxypeptidase [Deltaproteobacteria bacterium]